MRGYLFCVGAAKAGTTWLYEQLRTDPQLYFSPEKELHYFYSRYGSFDRLSNGTRFGKLREHVNRASANFADPVPDQEYARRLANFSRALNWYIHFAQGPVSTDWYRQLFAAAGERQYACDFSPSTSKISLDGLRAIRDLDKHIKIVYILRQPVERLWSHIKFHAQFMGKLDMIRNYSREELVGFIRNYRLDEDGLYGTYLQQILSIFSRADVLVMDYSVIKSAPVDFLTTVAEFLDIQRPTIFPRVERVINASATFDMLPGLLDEFKPEMAKQISILEDMGYSFVSTWRGSL